MRIGWIFEDVVEGTVQVMQVNPNSGASPAFKKNITTSTTTAPGNRVLLFEGSDEPQHFDFSGVILTKDHYDFILAAWQKRHLIRLTDDLGRTFDLYIESFTPTRKPTTAQYPWRHDYQATAIIVRTVA